MVGEGDFVGEGGEEEGFEVGVGDEDSEEAVTSEAEGEGNTETHACILAQPSYRIIIYQCTT